MSRVQKPIHSYDSPPGNFYSRPKFAMKFSGATSGLTSSFWLQSNGVNVAMAAFTDAAWVMPFAAVTCGVSVDFKHTTGVPPPDDLWGVSFFKNGVTASAFTFEPGETGIIANGRLAPAVEFSRGDFFVIACQQIEPFNELYDTSARVTVEFELLI